MIKLLFQRYPGSSILFGFAFSFLNSFLLLLHFFDFLDSGVELCLNFSCSFEKYFELFYVYHIKLLKCLKETFHGFSCYFEQAKQGWKLFLVPICVLALNHLLLSFQNVMQRVIDAYEWDFVTFIEIEEFVYTWMMKVHVFGPFAVCVDKNNLLRNSLR